MIHYNPIHETTINRNFSEVCVLESKVIVVMQCCWYDVVYNNIDSNWFIIIEGGVILQKKSTPIIKRKVLIKDIGKI